MSNNHSEIIVDSMPLPYGDYPHAHLFKNNIFVSGTGPRFQDSTSRPEKYVEQCQQVFRNLKTVLDSSRQGMELAIIDMSIFATTEENCSGFRFNCEEQLNVNAFESQPSLVKWLPGGILIEIKLTAQRLLHNQEVEPIPKSTFVFSGTKDQPFEDQFSEVFTKLEADLSQREMSMSDVVDVEIHLVNHERDWSEYNRLYQSRFSSPRPARTTIGVDAISTGGDVQIIATAIKSRIA